MVIPQATATPVLLERAKESMKTSVPDEHTAQNLDPIAALHARPPSSRKTGSIFKAEDVKPAKPTMNSGCRGRGWESGKIIDLGANIVKRLPARKLDFKT